jgi:UDP-glucuronate 4-epimerase
VATYLVTGVAGFIASKVAEQLLAGRWAHRRRDLDNLNDYYDVRLKDYRLSRLLDVSWPLSGARAVGGALRPDGFGLGSDPKRSAFAGNHQPATNNSGKFTFLPLDIENLPVMEEVFKTHKFDAVFNLAARAGVRYSLEFPELYRRTNVLGEENVLKCQVKYGVKKHVLASSSSVYAGCPMPFVEDARLGQMQSPYAETKHHAEMEAYGYHRVYGLDVTVLRYFTVFGPAGRPDMAPFRFIKWIDEGTPITLYGDGTQARDFTYVDDIARGTILAAKPLGYEVINLGGGNNPLSITAMIGIIEEAISSQRSAISSENSQVSGFRSQVSRNALINRLPSSPADMTATWADISKAKRLLGWAPQVSSEDGFRKTVEWHLLNRDLIKSVAL